MRVTPPIDPWRAATEPRPLYPTPKVEKEPKLTPVPTWRVAPLSPGVIDPWRQSGN